MFGRSKLIRDAITEATAPIVAKIAEAETHLEAARETMRQRAALVAMETEGRTLKLTFVRNGEIIQIETMLTLDQDLPGWRRQLLEPLP